ncbi:DUF1127 domain-containing protein [Bradyrhizobium barranii]
MKATPPDQAASPKISHSSIKALVNLYEVWASVGATLHLWRQRYRDRRELARWTEPDLHDIGVCVSAWNKDPVFGVIGIQSGPRDKGPQWLPSSHGSRGWDAGGGDDW